MSNVATTMVITVALYIVGAEGQAAPPIGPKPDPALPKGTKPVGKPASRRETFGFTLSATAEKGKGLIDAQSYEAADRFFLTELDASPTDAGLHCQYVRFLILARDPADPGFIRSPLWGGAKTHWAHGVAGKAAASAVQLDASCKAYLADLILSSFAARLAQSLDAGKGCVGKGRKLYVPETGLAEDFNGVEISMVGICWQALAIDPSAKNRWAERYETLARRCIRVGQVASAVMLANLTADLKQNGKQSEDFREATRAFLEALKHCKGAGQADQVKEAANAFPICFPEKLRAVEKGQDADPLFRTLQAELKARGVAIPLVEDHLRKRCLMPEPTPKIQVERVSPSKSSPSEREIWLLLRGNYPGLSDTAQSDKELLAWIEKQEKLAAGGTSRASVLELQVALGLCSLGGSQYRGGRAKVAEPLFRRAAAILDAWKEKVLSNPGPRNKNHLAMAWCLVLLGDHSLQVGRAAEAEGYLNRALAAGEIAVGRVQPLAIICLDLLARTHERAGRLDKARALLVKALAALDKVQGPKHPNNARLLDDYAQVLGKMNLHAEAKRSAAQAQAIRLAAAPRVTPTGDPDVKREPTAGLPKVERPSPESLLAKQLLGSFEELGGKKETWTIKLALGSSRHVLAANKISLETDGRVLLSPFRLAMFGPEQSDGRLPRIFSARGARAYLRLDKPILDIKDLNRRAIVGAELTGDIEITGGGFPGRKDADGTVLVPKESVFYFAEQQKIWTTAPVTLCDLWDQGRLIKVQGTGMDLWLSVRAATAKARGSSGIAELVIHSGVEAQFPLDPQSRFLALPSPVAPQAKGDKPTVIAKGGEQPTRPSQPQADCLLIRTPGSFAIDSPGRAALFQIPAPLPSGSMMTGPPKITVSRLRGSDPGKTLGLFSCDQLDIHFRGGDTLAPLTVDSAHATGRAISLALDSLETAVEGATDLAYVSPKTAADGTLVLRGAPLTTRQGHKQIQAREVHLGMPGSAAEVLRLTFQGPGRLFAVGAKESSDREHTSWKDTLVCERTATSESLTLNGDAAFLDNERGLKLSGQRVRADFETATAARKLPRPVLKRLEGSGKITAQCSELVVRQADYLLMSFRDSPAGSEMKPQETAEKSGTKPSEVSARSVRLILQHTGRMSQLQEAVAEGTVVFSRAAVKSGAKGLEAKCDAMQWSRGAAHNTVTYTGEQDRPAQLQLGEFFFLGPKIALDRARSTIAMEGIGAMAMPSKTTLDGGKLTAAASSLQVHWNKSMRFDGKVVVVADGVAASLENELLKCRTMQIELDGMVSFQEGQEGAASAGPARLVCDGDVVLAKSVADKGLLVNYQRLRTAAVDLDIRSGKVSASGPGQVTLFRPGTAPLMGKKEMQLTRIAFRGRLLWAAQSDRQMARFNEQVEVICAPAKDPDMAIAADRLPERAFFLSGDTVSLTINLLKGEEIGQLLLVERNASIRSPHLLARAGRISCDVKGTVVLERENANPVTVYAVTTGQTQPSALKANKVIFYPTSNQLRLDDTTIVNLKGTAEKGGK